MFEWFNPWHWLMYQHGMTNWAVNMALWLTHTFDSDWWDISSAEELIAKRAYSPTAMAIYNKMAARFGDIPNVPN